MVAIYAGDCTHACTEKGGESQCARGHQSWDRWATLPMYSMCQEVREWAESME